MAKKTAADTGSVDCTEQKRLNEAREAGIPWKKWGPYLSERQSQAEARGPRGPTTGGRRHNQLVVTLV